MLKNMYASEPRLFGIILLALSILLWGSWGNFLKLSKGTRFEIFYIDFVLGALLMSLIVGFTFGTWYQKGLAFFENQIHVHFEHVIRAFLAGILFNIANILLVASAAFSGLAYSFITCFGIALIIDTFIDFVDLQYDQPLFFFIGCGLIFLAILFISLSQRKIPHREGLAKKTFTLALVAGILIGLFYPLLQKALDYKNIERHDPFVTVFFFSIGLFISNLIINPFFMKKPIFGHPLTIGNYTTTKAKIHLFAVSAGVMWSLGLTLKLIGELIIPLSLAVSQGAVIVACLWGILLWREIPRGMGLYRFVVMSTFCYILGVIIIGISRLG